MYIKHRLIRSLYRVSITIGIILTLLGLCIAYSFYIEPHWLSIKHVKLSSSPTIRVIHITDIHFKGNRQDLIRVVETINGINADLVCFTGDMIEEASYLSEALEILSKINKPMYGVPGNHDKWALRSFNDLRTTFKKTGGEWLDEKAVLIPSKRIVLLPITAIKTPTPSGYKRILLEHYPDVVEQIHDEKFDLMLAGHTHGGQVRIPFLHRLFLDLGHYDKGLFQTPCGPLYVNPGIGTFYINARFLCRPEITVIEL